MSGVSQATPAVPVCRFGIIGGPGAGKTSFLGGLWYLAERAGISSFSGLTGEDDASQSLLLSAGRAVSSGECPAATVASTPVRASLMYKQRACGLAVSDYSGGEFVRRFTESSRESVNPLLPLFEGCGRVLVLLPCEPDESGETGGGLSGVQAALLNALRVLCPGGARAALVLTKADLAGEIPSGRRGAAGVLSRYAAGFSRRCRQEFGNLPVFCVSSYGHRPGVLPSPSPWGYDAVFDWLSDDVHAESRRFKRQALLGVLACAAAMRVGYSVVRHGAVQKPAESLNRVEQWVLGDAHVVEKLERSLGELMPTEGRLPVGELERRAGVCAVLKEKYLGRLRGRIRTTAFLLGTEKALNGALDDAYYTEAMGASEAQTRSGLLESYLQDPRGFTRHTAEAQAERSRLRIRLREDWVRLVSGVVPSDASGIRARISRAREGSSYFTPEEKAEFEEISEHVLSLLSRRRHRLTVVRAEGLRRAVDSRMWVDGGGSRDATSGTVSALPQWQTTFTLSWEAGGRIRLIWEDLEWVNEEIAYFTSEGMFSLPALLGTTTGRIAAGKESFFLSQPQVTVSYPDDLYWERNGVRSRMLLEKYILPGWYWSSPQGMGR